MSFIERLSGSNEQPQTRAGKRAERERYARAENLPGPAPYTAGPHRQDILNKLDPTVDSLHGGTQILGPGVQPASHQTYRQHAPGHSSNPQREEILSHQQSLNSSGVGVPPTPNHSRQENFPVYPTNTGGVTHPPQPGPMNSHPGVDHNQIGQPGAADFTPSPDSRTNAGRSNALSGVGERQSHVQQPPLLSHNRHHPYPEVPGRAPTTEQPFHQNEFAGNGENYATGGVDERLGYLEPGRNQVPRSVHHDGPLVHPGPASKTAGPHKSNLLNKLDPAVDSKATAYEQREYRLQ